MVRRAARQMSAPASRYARLTPFLRGAIYSLFLAGLPEEEIVATVKKPDGINPSLTAVRYTIKLCQAMGGMAWDGVLQTRAGRPQETSHALDRSIVRLVFKYRGRAKVTTDFVQKRIRAARLVSKRTVQRRLVAAGLKWLTRRRKSLVTSIHKPPRMKWAHWVLRRTIDTLGRWAFSDGTVFYLARTPAEKEHTSRGALGTRVWRAASGHDALFEDCVGPSAYWKGQGAPVRVWGLLFRGVLFITVLPIEERMNRKWYAWIIEHRFRPWVDKTAGAGTRVFLVQDHERALWTDEPRQAMRCFGVDLLTNFPKCSQDINPIEVAWRELRSRLAAKEPRKFESRAAFIVRLRRSVGWVNQHRAGYFMHLCSAQKEWARDVLAAKGARTKH